MRDRCGGRDNAMMNERRLQFCATWPSHDSRGNLTARDRIARELFLLDAGHMGAAAVERLGRWLDSVHRS